MPRDATAVPQIDPTLIFELFRGSYGTELLTAAVAHLGVFERLSKGPLAGDALAQDIGLARRPSVVLFTALKAMGLLRETNGQLSLTPVAAEHLTPGAPFFVGDYLRLAAESPGVLEMVARLRTNRPAGADDKEGAAFIFRDGVESAMEQEASARHFTEALAGRAKNVAPRLAEVIDLSAARSLLDVGGGTGIYSIAMLQRHPQLQATIVDRPEVLKVAASYADDYGVTERMHLVSGDMFQSALPPEQDVVLLSNILHDWDEPECAQLVARCAAALRPGGRLLIHDVFLNDALDGPLPIALYSASLFCFTEGRAYSAAEFRRWLTAAGLHPADSVIPTLIHCGCLVGTKPPLS